LETKEYLKNKIESFDDDGKKEIVKEIVEHRKPIKEKKTEVMTMKNQITSLMPNFVFSKEKRSK